MYTDYKCSKILKLHDEVEKKFNELSYKYPRNDVVSLAARTSEAWHHVKKEYTPGECGIAQR